MQRKRKINDELYDQLVLATSDIDLDQTDIELVLMESTARCFVGIEEEGNNDGPLIKLIQLTVDQRSDREPYCMALVQTVIAFVERRLGYVSLLIATESCVELWESTPDYLKYSEPFVGAIAVWRLKGTRKGHTGIVFKVSETHVYLVEGNTSPGNHSFNSQYEGDGIYFKKRPHGDVGSLELLGYILAF